VVQCSAPWCSRSSDRRPCRLEVTAYVCTAASLLCAQHRTPFLFMNLDGGSLIILNVRTTTKGTGPDEQRTISLRSTLQVLDGT
jgi:hypothetical protein